MKNPFFILLYIFFIIIILPVLLTIGIYKDNIFKEEVVQNKKIESLNIKVYNSKEDKVETMNLEEYLYNVVASEMPATFNEEALKAQAIAARSYVFYKMENGGDKIPQHKGAVVCTDHNHCQEYLTIDQLKKAHGQDWMEKLWPKIKKAVDDTRGKVLVYEGKTIQPLYHSTSGGKTENSEEVFSAKLPYLRSVDSPYEQGSPKLVSNVKISKNDFVNKFKSNDIVISDNIKKDIKILSRTEGGSVKEIKVGNKVIRGRDVRKILNLNSSDFEIKVSDNYVNIITKGYGHGVGMSQWGANGMANKGYKYDEILKHYFKGVKIEKKY
ncbi:stage II sporulation protein D [Tepidibacter formicigenes]|jgi:stage II sporulation protein D|uniref:Stage II sporulation protein D n=1 Tax=Tepidibacter formicigenes DSM 15518 TaxID=1123349 RepID=A0A1M6SQ61_9FIRM|nr:stage II sporulation protein D [Tepidibacter formicigenes]SHK46871.1 stage II sporulation protein D [Tepidibacter formicigenes DSM 15518]